MKWAVIQKLVRATASSMYDGSYDAVGFDSVEEAWQELVDIKSI